MPLVSVNRAHFGAEVVIGDYVDISGCDFRQADLSRFRLDGAHLFPPGRPRLSNPPDGWHLAIPDETMLTTYRQLRSALARGGQDDLAARLLVAEMDTRRRMGVTPRGDRWLLWIHRALSRYSTSVLLPVLWLVGIAVAGGVLLRLGGFGAGGMVEAWTVSGQSVLGPFWAPTGGLTAGERWVQLGLRAAGAIVLVQLGVALYRRLSA